MPLLFFRRVAEILTNKSLAKSLRVPASSRLQKIHNVDLALSALKAFSAKHGETPIPEDITSRAIVEGHMEKTLALMWFVIFGFQIGQIVNAEKLRKEIDFLQKSIRYRAQIKDREAANGLHFVLDCQRRDLSEEMNSKKKDNLPHQTTMTSKDAWSKSEKMKLLLTWARLVCGHYNVEIENMSVSFSDGRAFCFLLHHYHPSFLPRSEICLQTSVAQREMDVKGGGDNKDASLDDSFGSTMTYSFGAQNSKLYAQLLENEKKNFKTFYEKVRDL